MASRKNTKPTKASDHSPDGFENCTVRVDGTKLILEIDLTEPLGPNDNGKQIILAKSGGYRQLGLTQLDDVMPKLWGSIHFGYKNVEVEKEAAAETGRAKQEDKRSKSRKAA